MGSLDSPGLVSKYLQQKSILSTLKMATDLPALEHPSLGHIQGIQAPGHPKVEQYLGIQYAKLANRFARGTLAGQPSTPMEATTVG